MIAFSMRIGDTNFELQISSFGVSRHGSEVTVEYLPSIDEIENEPDALLKLRNFHGTMRISRIHTSSDSISKTKCVSKAESRFDSYTNVSDKHAHAKKSFLNSTSNTGESDQGFLSISTDIYSDENGQINLENESSNITNSIPELSLHRLCNKKNASVGKLRSLLSSQPSLARQYDDLGRLPLHVICRNASLVCGRRKKEFKTFVKHLYSVYPEALNIADRKGHIPFSEAIEDWINNSYQDCCRIRDEDRLLPSNVELFPIVKWSFEMLSEIMDEAPSDYYKLNDLVVDKISTIKSLVKTILGINDPEEISGVLNSSIFRKILVKKQALGPWIVKMLSNSSEDASRVIDYFEILSSSKLVTNTLVEDNLVNHMSQLKEMIPSINNLTKAENLRAARTRIVQQLLSSYFMDPILIASIFVDTCFHILLVINYNTYFWSIMRIFGYADAEYRIKADEIDKTFADVPSYAIVWLSVYFLIQDDLTNILVARSLKHFLRIYLLPDNLIKFVTLIFTLATPIYTFVKKKDLKHEFIYPVSCMLLWLRLLLFLKGNNIKLSAFIVTMNKIIVSMTWFLVIFAIGCYSFGSVMTMTIYTTAPEYCDGVNIKIESIEGDFCSLNPNRGAIRAYAMMAGDISLDDYNMNNYTTLVWILYTMYGVIVLLNVLIAIVNDSYQESYSNRLALANSERIPFLSKHLRLRSLARKFFGTEIKCRCLWISFCFSLSIIFFLVWHWILFRTVQSNMQLTSLNALYYTALQIICTLFADISLIYIGLKVLDVGLCFENNENKWMVFARKQVKNVALVLLGMYDQSEFRDEEDYFVTMREAIDKSESRINSKLDEIQNQMSMLLFGR